MDKDVAISVKNVFMSFNLNKEKVDNLKEYAIKLVTHKLEYKKFDALKNISFEVKKGEHLAILGFNGAGKSTLLKTIVGVYKPTRGKVEKCGVVAPLLELGAGFDPNYSGKENIYLYGAILGYSREYIEKKYKEIVEFSELGNFINVPLKNYSSGMKARLGFSIATAVEPDVLILDEVLSVGDAKFREKSLKKVQSMFDKGVTVIFVSHSIAQVRAICDKAILLNHGEIIAQGDVKDVSALYEKITKGDKNDQNYIAKEVAEYNNAQRKKQIAAGMNAPSYGTRVSAVSAPAPRRTAASAVSNARPSAVKSTAGSMPTRTMHIDIPKRAGTTASSQRVTSFVDVYSSSQKAERAESARKRTQQNAVAQERSVPSSVSNSTQATSSGGNAVINKAELEEIIRNFSR
ncbi:MAG: ABC transporter ATP-binding protein [Eubacterium sp.]|nr:ABC transporter ATP-binding protein [Eubacterium sp.]